MAMTNHERIGKALDLLKAGLLPFVEREMKAEVEVSLEVRAEIPDGAPDREVRIVSENCRTLKFADFGFEKS